ncbi:hypothetical protein QTP70_015225, partial [Hemibagrus guttatus]
MLKGHFNFPCPGVAKQDACVAKYGEDSFELHSVDLELEAVEKQTHDLQVKQTQLRQRKAALESSRTDAHLSQVLKKIVTMEELIVKYIAKHGSQAMFDGMENIVGEDSFELHSVDLELEAVEKQTHDLQVKQTQLRQRKATLESSRTDAHLSQAEADGDPGEGLQGAWWRRLYHPDGLHPSRVGAAVLSDNISPGTTHHLTGLDLQHALGCFAAECEAAGVRVSTSKSEAMVLDRKKVACTLQVGEEVLPQVEEFKYLGVLFMSEGRMDREIDRRIGAAAAVMRSMYRSVVVKKELSRKAKLSIYQSIYAPTLTYGHELWVMTER